MKYINLLSFVFLSTSPLITSTSDKEKQKTADTIKPNESWCQKNLEQVCNQPSEGYYIVFQDEAPPKTDGTGELIRSCLQKRVKQEKVNKGG